MRVRFPPAPFTRCPPHRESCLLAYGTANELAPDEPWLTPGVWESSAATHCAKCSIRLDSPAIRGLWLCSSLAEAHEEERARYASDGPQPGSERNLEFLLLRMEALRERDRLPVVQSLQVANELVHAELLLAVPEQAQKLHRELAADHALDFVDGGYSLMR